LIGALQDKMGIVIAFPILLILIILQTTLVSQVTLLSGCADLVLLWLAAWALQKQVKSAWIWTILAGIAMAFVSAIPWYVPLISYAVITFFARAINKRIWQSPLLMMFMVTILGSILINGLSYMALAVSGVSIPFRTGLVQVIIPSTLINLLLALPMFSLVKDTAQWVYPIEVSE
jgi:cell shape-determining protein MreD